MTIYSYAQNGEDVILQRALADVTQGFYVDVGAQHPRKDSVTQAFYERGWSGINIEPEANYLQQLRESRSRDTNLGVVASDQAGLVSFYQIPGSGLSTTELMLANQAKEDHGFDIETKLLPCLTLTQIIESCGQSEVHFLKIDVEGAEARVLQGIDLQAIRPWIIVAESIDAFTRAENYRQWESLLLDSNYRFVHADGLNRYYLAAEHDELAEAFRYPPNLFDESVPADLRDLHSLLQSIAPELASPASEPRNTWEYFSSAFQMSEQLKQHQMTLAATIEKLRDELASHQHSMEELRHDEFAARVAMEQRIRSMRRSGSWIVTAPLREVARGAKKSVRLLSKLRSKPTKGDAHPRGEGLVKRNLRSLERRVRRLRNRWLKKTPVAPQPIKQRQDSERVNQIFHDLQQAASKDAPATSIQKAA